MSVLEYLVGCIIVFAGMFPPLKYYLRKEECNTKKESFQYSFSISIVLSLLSWFLACFVLTIYLFLGVVLLLNRVGGLIYDYKEREKVNKYE